jgi:hypothetical protein
MKTKIRLPSLLKSPDACLKTAESLPIKYMVIRKQQEIVKSIRMFMLGRFVWLKGSDEKLSSVNTLIDHRQSYETLPIAVCAVIS